jgi:hypothetical protein
MTTFPHSFPYPESETPTSSPVFATLVARIGPPWLRRAGARRILGALASPLDTIADAMVAGVRARFPVWTSDALSLLGRERRIRRGPTETSATYAPRLRLWLDAHRGRGGAYALLEQLRAYWRGSIDGTHAVLSHGGVLHESIGDVVTREPFAWIADGSALWPQVWVMLHLDADPRPVSAVDDASFRAVPVEWSAAHIWRVHVVLLWDLGRLWEYPDPTLTWATWDLRDAALAALTWDTWDDQMPITLTHEES